MMRKLRLIVGLWGRIAAVAVVVAVIVGASTIYAAVPPVPWIANHFGVALPFGRLPSRVSYNHRTYYNNDTCSGDVWCSGKLRCSTTAQLQQGDYWPLRHVGEVFNLGGASFPVHVSPAFDDGHVALRGIVVELRPGCFVSYGLMGGP